jgi:hypothetical protein
VERTFLDYPHGKTQAVITAFFLAIGKRLALHPCVETRMKLNPSRYPIPDVAVFIAASSWRARTRPIAVAVTSSWMPSSRSQLSNDAPTFFFLMLLCPLLSTPREVEIMLCGLLRFFDEAMQQHHASPLSVQHFRGASVSFAIWTML